ncbi:hypothetical protein Hdeb2414_s0014g00427641 [Helianthus debilis subsp. tardiflorus]
MRYHLFRGNLILKRGYLTWLGLINCMKLLRKTKICKWIERRIKLHILGNKRVASVLCNHEKDVIFEALEQCLKSKPIIIAKKCLVIATWLVYMLYNLPDTGVRDSARRSLLNEYIHILQSSKNLEDKILATVALRSFISDPEMWSASEGFESDSSLNGEVLSLIHVKRRVISSHSDGTIKVWIQKKFTVQITRCTIIFIYDTYIIVVLMNESDTLLCRLTMCPYGSKLLF